jgi:hypothetical protein
MNCSANHLPATYIIYNINKLCTLNGIINIVSISGKGISAKFSNRTLILSAVVNE